MPELPEIEVILRNIKYSLIRKKILYTIVRCKKLRYPVSHKIYEIKNEKILNVKRRAKYLIFVFCSGYMLIHLGMSGSLHLIKINKKIDKHDHIDFIINNNKVLRYRDPRRFGLCIWTKKLKNLNLLNNLGIEPLSSNLTQDFLFEKSRYKKTKIKNFLMDNKIITGIGNIYSNEILFDAKILPYRMTMSLTLLECKILTASITNILCESIKLGGTTIKDFVNIDNKKGNFYKKLKIYKKYGKECYICSNFIKKTFINNRSTYFCDFCQK